MLFVAHLMFRVGDAAGIEVAAGEGLGAVAGTWLPACNDLIYAINCTN